MADPSTCPPLSPESIAKAHEKIQKYIHETPLLTSMSMNEIASSPDPSLFLSSSPPSVFPSKQIHDNSASTSPSIPPPKFKLFFKCENQQKIGAFKARGAFHALVRLIDVLGTDEVRRRGVITHSSGNHAQALALAAFTFNVTSYIVMPSISTPSKIAGTKMYTRNVIFSGSTSVEREAKVAEVQAETQAILVPPYDHPDIILGQGTAGKEFEAQYQTHKADDHARFDAVITPLGGGGLLSGTATWFSHTSSSSHSSISSSPSHSPSSFSSSSPPPFPASATTTATATSPRRTLVFGAEPNFSGANDGERGLSASPPTRVEHVSSLTIADGLRTPVGVYPWSVISDKSKLEAVFSASEDEIKWALRLMLERVKLFVEPSSAVPVAVILFNQKFRDFVARQQQQEGTGRPWDVGIVLSGGNTTVEALAKLFGPKASSPEGDSSKASSPEVRAEVNQEKGEIDMQNEEAGERQTGQIGLDGTKVAEDVAG